MKFKKGDIVWAKPTNEPHWPAKIMGIAAENCYKVRFIKDNSTAVIESEHIEDFAKSKSKYSNGLKTKKFLEAIKQASMKTLSDKAAEVTPTVIKKKKSAKSKGNGSEDSYKEVPTEKKIRKPRNIKEADLDESVQEIKQVQEKIEEKPKEEVEAKVTKQKVKKSPKESKKQSKTKVVPEVPSEPMEVEIPASQIPPITYRNFLSQPEAYGFLILQKIRKLVDHIILQIYSQSFSKSPEFNDEMLDDLNELTSLIQEKDIQVEDLITTRTSNGLFFIVKQLSKNSYVETAVRAIKSFLHSMSNQLKLNFESTEMYDRILSEVNMRDM